MQLPCCRLSCEQRPEGLRYYNIPQMNVLERLQGLKTAYKIYTTFSNGSLGSRIDEERSEMR